MRTSALVVATALVAMSAVTVVRSALAAAETVHFAYVIEEGHSQAYKVKFNQDTDMGFFTMSAFVDMEVTETCIAADSAGYDMEMTFDKVEASRMYQDRMSEDPLAARLVGGTVTYRVDRHGKVTDLKSSGLIEEWAQAKKVVKPIVESGYSWLPDKEVPIGGQWGRDGEMEKNEQGMEITTTSRYKYKESKEQKGHNCARVEGELENRIGGAADTQQGPMMADGTGEGKFEMYFDVVSHTIVKVKASMDIRIDLTPEDGGDPIETTVTYSLEREIM